jgi:hypothetical protein
MFTTFYNGTIRKYVVLFGTLFSDIYINRVGKTQEQDFVQTLRVPLSYGPKEKYLARTDVDPTISRPMAIVLPRMSFEILSITYDGTRKLPKLTKFVHINADDSSKLKYTYAPVPYNIDFQLSIMTKNADDGTRIIEQILPYFTPDYTSTINLIPELDLKLDIPLMLNNVDYSDTYDGSFIDRRAIIWTLSFTMKAYLFGPVKGTGSANTGNIIKTANTSFYLDTNATDPSESVIVTPGLIVNGQVTNTTPISEIYANSNYGFLTDFIGLTPE